VDEAAIRSAVVEAVASLDVLRGRFTDLLAALDGQDDGIQVPGQGRWTKDRVAALWEGVHHLQGARALFEVTAAHANEAVSFEQVRSASGLTAQEQRNHHARITRVAAKVCGETRWPIQSWQSAAGPDGKVDTHYRMGATVAEWWREAAGEPAAVDRRPAPPRRPSR
jgi:hypothetical protein